MKLEDWLTQAEARCERAPKGPWLIEIPGMMPPAEDAAADFVGWARTDLPRALKLLRSALAVVEAARHATNDDHFKDVHGNDVEECCVDGGLYDALRAFDQASKGEA